MALIVKKSGKKMAEKFEKCEGCWIENKGECLILFGSTGCLILLLKQELNGDLKNGEGINRSD